MNSTTDNRVQAAISLATLGLTRFIDDGMTQKLDLQRLARVGYALVQAGCSLKGSFLARLGSYIAGNQQRDGGWTDAEETAWCLSFLNKFGNSYAEEIRLATAWLNSSRQSSGGWGKNNRDKSRIPITALVIALVPEVASVRDFEWLARQWQDDVSSPTQLSYKGAFFLLSVTSRTNQYAHLVDVTIDYLNNEQEEDGGFGPWKGHPVGSCPWTTGVVLWGLSKTASKVSSRTLKRAVAWLESKQLPNGLWPYHYLDDATAMVVIGLSAISPLVIE